MRHVVTLAAVAVIGLAVWLWGLGGADQVMRWAVAAQAETQNAMAGLLQRLRAGDRAALWGLWSLCFAYGFFHAAGPGHGKILIGGYGVGARVPLMRLSSLAVLSSIAQAVTAIALVYAGVFLIGLSRDAMTETAERWMAPLSYGAIALVGAWLGLRGLRRWWRWQSAVTGDTGRCGSCGHRHAPDADEAARVRSLRDALAIVAAIAVRPCTGALFLLILTARLGLDLAGIIGALFMGLGTASVTLAVALAAVSFREGAVRRLMQGTAVARAVPLVEMAAGGVIMVISLQLMIGTL